MGLSELRSFRIGFEHPFHSLLIGQFFRIKIKGGGSNRNETSRSNVNEIRNGSSNGIIPTVGFVNTGGNSDEPTQPVHNGMSYHHFVNHTIHQCIRYFCVLFLQISHVSIDFDFVDDSTQLNISQLNISQHDQSINRNALIPSPPLPQPQPNGIFILLF